MNRAELLRRMLEQVDPSGRSEGLPAKLESRTASTEGPSLDVRVKSAEAEMAVESLDVLRRGGELDSEQQFVLEAIVMPFHRPVVDVVDDYINTNQLTNKWRKLADEAHRPWIKERVRSVGRINVPDLPSLPYAGTGFIVGDGLLMTNRHVASIFAQGLGTRVLQFQAGQSAAIDFYHENGKSTTESLTVEKVTMIHPWWDMALLKVRGLPPNREPLKLSTADPSSLRDHEVVVIGYPGYDPSGDDEFQRIQNRIFRGTYYIKRFQPGLFRVREMTESYQRMVEAVTHDCSTLGGNSGSAVIDVQSGHVVGLHFAGAYLVGNYAVSPFDLAQDSKVVDAGVNFDGTLISKGDFYGPIWRDVDASESAVAVNDRSAVDWLSRADRSTGPIVQTPATITQASQAIPTFQGRLSPSSVNWTIPVHVSVSPGNPTHVASTVRPLGGPGVPAEGLFDRQRPDTFSEFIDQFSPTSLVTTKFEWPTALSLALASRLSYENPIAVQNAVLNTWKMQTCEFIEADDTQCFVASSQQAVLVSFRGTESLGDWLGNLNAISTTRTYGTVHRGFLGAFQVVDSQLRSALSHFAGRPVLLTGHSLGGALATVAAAEWRGQIPISWLYTFGQPAVGKGNYRAFIEQHFAGKFFRFVNDDDIVPRVPPTYRHIGSLYHFDAAGNLRNNIGSFGTESTHGVSTPRPEASDGTPMLTPIEFDHLRAQLLEQRAQGRASGLESLEAPVLEGMLPSISDHSMDRYLAKIAIHAKA